MTFGFYILLPRYPVFLLEYPVECYCYKLKGKPPIEDDSALCYFENLEDALSLLVLGLRPFCRPESGCGALLILVMLFEFTTRLLELFS